MADRLGLTSAFVSAIETGRKPIPQAYIDNIARALSLSEREIRDLRQAEDQTRTTIKVESLKGADRALVASLARKVNELPPTELDVIRRLLGDYLGPSALASPLTRNVRNSRYSSEQIHPLRRSKPALERGFASDACHRFSFRVPPLPAWQIEEQANRCRALFLTREQIWFPIVEVLEFALPRIITDFNLEIHSAEELAIEGMLLPRSSTIIVHEDLYDEACAGWGRARFTLCHELGHFVLHRALKATLDTQKRRGHRLYEDSEWQADRFAAALLAARAHGEYFDSISELVKKCGISRKAAEVRWSQLNDPETNVSASASRQMSDQHRKNLPKPPEMRHKIRESRISASETENLATELDVIGMAVAEANIPQSLRQLLLKHISYLSWAIRNFDSMTIEGIRAAFTPSAIQAITDVDEEAEAAHPDVSPWYQRLLGVAQRIMKALNLADDGLRKVNDIKNNIDDLFK